MSGLIVVHERFDEPTHLCRVCGGRLYEDEYVKHVVGCAERHEDETRQWSYRNKAPGLFDPKQSGDVELTAWVRAHRKAIMQGRIKI